MGCELGGVRFADDGLLRLFPDGLEDGSAISSSVVGFEVTVNPGAEVEVEMLVLGLEVLNVTEPKSFGTLIECAHCAD
jgi:hypothetical protein